MVLGDLGSVLGDPGRVLVNFWRILGGPEGRKKKLHFQEANRMKLSGTNYPLLKTENLLLIHGSISEKLSLYRFFGTQKKKLIFWVFLAGPGSRRPAPGPGSRAGPGNIEKHVFFFWAGPGPARNPEFHGFFLGFLAQIRTISWFW